MIATASRDARRAREVYREVSAGLNPRTLVGGARNTDEIDGHGVAMSARSLQAYQPEVVRTYAHDREAAQSPTGESAVNAYLQKMSRLRSAEQSLHAAAPGSTEYKTASTRYERLTRELMDDFARAVRSVR